MEKKELGKRVLIGAIVLGVFSGAAWGASRYWTGSGFQPTGSGRALRSNQVLFEDQRSGLSEDGGSSQDSFWEDSNAEDQVADQQQSGYLFSPDKTTPDVPTAGVVNPNGSGSNTGGTPSTGIDITNRPGAGNVISGGGSSGGSSGGTASPTTPSGGVSGSGTVSDPYRGGSVIQDPNDKKDRPYNFGDEPIHITDQSTISVQEVIIGKPWSTTAALLYRGETVNSLAIFVSLETYVRDSSNKVYYWDTEDLGKTFRIDSISFDGENWITMTDSTTVTIPESAQTMYIRTSYRLSPKDDWTQADPVAYPLEDSRVLLLNTTVKSETAITEKMLINFDKDNQHLKLGHKANLLRWVQELMVARGETTYQNARPLKTLFTGWTEDGKAVPWRYEITPGRHVLQAPKNISFNTEIYQAEIRHYWMDENYAITDTPVSDSLSYLQTLTYYKGPTSTEADGSRHLLTLSVPKYIQAVDFPYYYLVTDTLKLPDTVLYVNTDGVPDLFDDEINYDHGLQVSKAYTVDEGNPRYTAEDGILYDLERTEILGVPTEITSLTVPSSVTSIHLPYRSKLDTITLQAEDISQVPDINYTRLKRGCKILVEDGILEEFLRVQADVLRSARMTVSSVSHPDKAYTIQDSLIVSTNNTLHGVLDEGIRWLPLPETITGLEAGCLEGLSNLTMLHLPNDGRALTFEEDCFRGADSLETIVCYSQAQYDAAVGQAPEGVRVLLADAASKDGYRYLDMGNGNIMLLEVPADLTEFNGLVPDPEGGTIAVTAISSDVFSKCSQLRWVDLPKEVTAIGQNAFRGCIGLEGVVIGADTVMIGKGAFDGCTSLRFLASNAKSCELYSPDLALPGAAGRNYSFLYCPAGSTGYNGNWRYFDESDNITAYSLQDCGGTKVLYGETDGECWLALRSGGSIDGDVSLPLGTEYIYLSAFEGAAASNGKSFDLNWSDLEYLEKIFGYSFYGSDIGQDVVLAPDLELDRGCFSKCNQLKSITIPSEYGYVNLDGELFQGCHGLESVTIGDVAPFSALYFGIFDDCPSLSQVIFTGGPPELAIRNYGTGFRFNYVQFPEYEDEEAHVRLVVPEEEQEAFALRWRYGYAGYVGNSRQSDYEIMWDEIARKLRNQGKDASDAAVKAEVEALLTAAENHVRSLMGMAPVSTATHRYSYSIGADGRITLTGAKDVSYAELEAKNLELPSGRVLSSIGANAFAQSPNLRMVDLPDTLVSISADAFSGVEASADQRLLLKVMGAEPPALVGYEEGTPFSFGIEDAAVEVMGWSDDSTEEAILKAWAAPMAGYDSLASLYKGTLRNLRASGVTPTPSQLEAAILQSLLTAENRLRGMLDMDPITDPADMTGITAEEVHSLCFRGGKSVLSMEDAASAPEEPVPVETDPTQTEPAESEETVPPEMEPTEPQETEPTETDPTEPGETSPTETEPEETEETAPSEPEETAPAETAEAES